MVMVYLQLMASRFNTMTISCSNGQIVRQWLPLESSSYLYVEEVILNLHNHSLYKYMQSIQLFHIFHLADIRRGNLQ